MKDFFKRIADFFKNSDPAYDFPVDVETTQTGDKLYVEKGRHRIEIFDGEKSFYLANGWSCVI